MFTKNGNILKINGNWLNPSDSPVPPSPVLPDNTIRLKYADGVTPIFTKGTPVQVSSSPNVWDLTYGYGDWSNLTAYNNSDLIEVIDANTSNVTDMSNMFSRCNNLTSVPLFDTSNVTSMYNMFGNCAKLTSIPLFNTSKVTNMETMFWNCYRVESGALDLYLQASTQSSPPWNHSNCFHNCGSQTLTGSAELSQIPSSWGGNGA